MRCHAAAWSCRLALAAVLLAPAGCIFEDEIPGLREKTTGDSVAVEVNSVAPAFAAKTLDGGTVRLADFVGRHVILLEFWSIFCKSCLEEMPHIEDLYARYRDDGLVVLSVNTDVFSTKKIRSFLERAGIAPPYPVVRDPRQDVVAAYHVELLPVTVIIDKEGWIRLYQEGYRPGDEDRFARTVRRLLGKRESDDVTLAPSGGVTAFAPAGEVLAAPGTRIGAVPLRRLDGAAAATASGAPQILFFWSLYCRPCRAEFPEVQTLRRDLAAAGVQVFAVNVDSARLEARVTRFAQDYPELPGVLDTPEAGDGDIARQLGVRATPSLVLLDGAGRVVYSESGTSDFSKLRAALEESLGARQL